MSKQEKIAWVALIGIVLISGYYVIKLISFEGDIDIYSREMRRIIHFIISIAIPFHVVAYIIQNHRTPDVAEDERDIIIQKKANNVAHCFLEVSLIIGISALIFGPEAWLVNSSPVITAHLLLAVLIGANIAKYFSQVLYYRLQ